MVETEGLGRFIDEHPFFKGMEAASRELVTGCATNVRFDAGTYVFREGQPADKFYLVRTGAVQVELHVPGRDTMVLQTVDDGEILGWSWLIPPYRWSFDARVTQLTRAVALDAACLRGKMEGNHTLGFELLRRMVPVLSERIQAGRMQLIDMYGAPEAPPRRGR